MNITTGRLTRALVARGLFVAPLLMTSACTKLDPARQTRWAEPETPEQRRARLCLVSDSADKIPLWRGAASSAAFTFDDLVREVDTACKSCHLTPAAQGGFTYQDSYRGGLVWVGTTRVFV